MSNESTYLKILNAKRGHREKRGRPPKPIYTGDTSAGRSQMAPKAPKKEAEEKAHTWNIRHIQPTHGNANKAHGRKSTMRGIGK